MADARAPGSFVLAVDKPAGPTSHDVVAWARRAFGTRAVGHAGTLDPAATGVLVLAVEEATKLVPYLTLDDKEYDATLLLGAETDTLDAEGAIVERAPVPPLSIEQVRRAVASFLGPSKQRPPVYSAIKQQGVALHERARRGEVVEVAERDVEAFSLEVVRVEGATLEIHLHVGKGYYVRSFARDLARALGTVGHLVALRRTRSGAFGLEHAIEGTSLSRAARDPEHRPALLDEVARVRRSLTKAVPQLATLTLSDEEEIVVRHGKPLAHAQLASVPEAGTCKLVRDDRLVAIARREGDVVRVVRGFVRYQDGAS